MLEKPVIKNITDANFPMDPEGRTYHLAVKKGDGLQYKTTTTNISFKI